MTEKVLFVDDDPNLLASCERNFRNKFQVETADGGEAALEKIASRGPFAVVVSDRQMPRMDGILFLSLIKERAPDTVRLMLTGNADLEGAIKVVNEGNIFRFLTKPCSALILGMAIQDALAQYRLVTAERELLEKTLNGSVKLLTDVLALTDPLAFGHGESLRKYMRAYVQSLVMDSWELEIAAMLSQIGAVTVPPAVLEKQRNKQELNRTEQDLIERIPKAGSDLLANIPRLETVARIVLYQQKHYDGSGFPANVVRGEDIPIGARILKVLVDLMELEAQKMSKDAALALMQQRTGWYDPRVLDATFACFDIYLAKTSAKSQGQPIGVKDLRAGHVVLTGIQMVGGKTVVMSRCTITPVLLARLNNLAKVSPIQEPIYIEPQAAG